MITGKICAIACCVLPVLPTVSAFSQRLSAESPLCATATTIAGTAASDRVGGIHITASGTLRILLVFVSFPDDETVHPFWPAHHPPASMEQFIDPDTLTRSRTAWNLTNYFRQ